MGAMPAMRLSQDRVGAIPCSAAVVPRFDPRAAGPPWFGWGRLRPREQNLTGVTIARRSAQYFGDDPVEWTIPSYRNPPIASEKQPICDGA